MNETRTNKSIRNIIVSIGSYFLIILLQVFNRTVFVKYLPVEYLGLNGLFSNILSMLSLSELGIGTAMVYALYKPIASDDKETIKSIMNVYKKLYIFVGMSVLVLGFAITPFLKYLIKDAPGNIGNLHFYYLIYVLNSGVSYFYTYKRSLIICDQKQYVSNIVTTVLKVICTLCQMLVLVYSQDYVMYLVVMVICTFAENLVISHIVDKRYSYIREKNIKKLDSGIVKEIKKNIFAMVFHRVGDVVVNATDNLIITRFVSISVTGFYSNYTLVINAIKNVIIQLFSSLTASVGNLIAAGDKEHDKIVFDRILFADFWIFSFAAICLKCLINPFISVWLGENFLLGEFTVDIICLNFYLTGMQKTVRLFRDAAGVFWYDRYKPVAESIVNLVASIPLAIKFGVAGTLMGTLISNLTVAFWVEAYVLFRYHFEKSLLGYFRQQLKFGAVTLIVSIIVYRICDGLTMIGVAGFITKMFICAVLPNLIFLIIFYKNAEMKYYRELLKKMILSVLLKLKIKQNYEVEK